MKRKMHSAMKLKTVKKQRRNELRTDEEQMWVLVPINKDKDKWANAQRECIRRNYIVKKSKSAITTTTTTRTNTHNKYPIDKNTCKNIFFQLKKKKQMNWNKNIFRVHTPTQTNFDKIKNNEYRK